MTRDEATARGLEVHDTQHSMKRRTPWHDYSLRGTYMLTLVVEGRAPLLGTLRASDDGSGAHVELTTLGRAIRDEEVPKMARCYPQLEVWKVCLMPDHLHLIVRVNADLGEGKHLGKVVRGFKTGCSRAWWRLEEETGRRPGGGPGGGPGGKAPGTAAAPPVAGRRTTVPSASPEGLPASPEGLPASPEGLPASPEGLCPVLFERGYNDKILLHEGQLERWKHYLDDNPRRLLLKRRHPQLFTVLHDMEVAGERCQVVGNRFLLDIPDKMAVIVHRRYTDGERARLREEWLACGERGGVLVSAAIAPAEKEVLREAMDRGYRLILLRENGFPELYKPSGEAFDACTEGRLLQVSPWQYHMERTAITRAQCLHLNALAERLAEGG